MPHPRQRASAVVGAATDANATALAAARTVKDLVMESSGLSRADNVTYHHLFPPGAGSGTA